MATTVWHRWASTSSTETTCATGTADVWINWIGDTTTATSTTTCTSATTWSYWCDSTSSTAYVVPRLTEAQIRENERQAEHWRKQAAEEKKKREVAEKRAQELLEANLKLEERDRLRKHGHFHVCGKSGTRYRIRKGRSANVDVIDKDGRITHRLCAHPADAVPDQDTMLAQKLMLECDEERFLAIANRHAGGGEQVMPAMH